MKKINREAGDKTKGFTLQKQRALALFFDELKINPNTHVNVAVEYRGDVFLQNGDNGYTEEAKNYDQETKFSFNSREILNTLAYFLEIWLTEGKSNNVKFGFYSTNQIGKENNTEKTKRLNIVIPDDGLLNLVVQKKYDDDRVLDSVRKYITDEFNQQYRVDITSKLAVDETCDPLINFLNTIVWNFEQDNEKDYYKHVLEKIGTSEFASNLKTPFQQELVYAALMWALEAKQDEQDPILKFLRKDSVELVFVKAVAGEIDNNAYRYLNFDLSELRGKVKSWLKTFLEMKYFSNVKNKVFPPLISRKVSKHNRETKIERKNLEQTDREKAKSLDVVIRDLGDFINDDKPTFLFGEIGSGKSTLLAHHFMMSPTDSILPIFIPPTYLKGKITSDLADFKKVVNEFVNHELDLTYKFFDLDLVLFSQKEITLIVDGVDEFEKTEASQLIKHLLNLSNGVYNLRIIASGRPIELQGLINYNHWNCLTTLDLGEEEVKLILKNEALGLMMSEAEAEADALERLEILKSKSELLSNATTPLIVGLIRDFLDENLSSQTMGDILYEVVKRRLDWHQEDQKESLKEFLEEFPNTFQRENFISDIAGQIYKSKTGRVTDEILFQTLNSEGLIKANHAERNKVVDQAISFFKSNFLQQVGNTYAFQSHQLFQLIVGLHIFKLISSGKEVILANDRIDSWREISYAAAVARKQGKSSVIESFLETVVDDLLFTEDNTAATSVLLAEAQITALNIRFLDKIQNLSFRPLRFWGYADSLVPHAYAYIFSDLGSDGFNWFFNSYLNPAHPFSIGHDDNAATILKYYFIRSQFVLSPEQKAKLSSIIPVHLAAQSYSCTTLLPIITLSIPEAFDTEQRSILLSDALRRSIVNSKAEELLRREFKDGRSQYVKNGLEIACSSIDSKPLNAVRLWLALISDKLPKIVLDTCIQLIAKGEASLFAVLQNRIGSDKLHSYCRLNALSLGSIADSAAIILFEYYGETNPILIAEPIMKKTYLFDYADQKREKILDRIIYKQANGYEFILSNIPPLNNSEISDVYVKYFLGALLQSETLHLNEFINVVRDLSKFCLARYPELREAFSHVLELEPYYNALEKSLSHLDNTLRFKAASVLIVCNPSIEQRALEIIIRSAYPRNHDDHEMLRLCMKLVYNNHTLDFIYSLLDDLPDVSRVFALKILYHNNQHRLSPELLDELIEGLLAKADFLDWSGHLGDDGIESITSDEIFYEKIKQHLCSTSLELKTSAASKLLSYFASRLTIEEKAMCWTLYIQDSEYALLDFQKRFLHLFDDKLFVKGIEIASTEIEKLIDQKPFFKTYFEAIIKKENWREFFLGLLKGRVGSDYRRLEFMYGPLIKIGNIPEQREQIGFAVKEIMGFPAYSENIEHNMLLPQLAVLAHEFGTLTKDEIAEFIDIYSIPQTELTSSLLYRLGYLPESFEPKRRSGAALPFLKNNTVTFSQFSEKELDVFLQDGEVVPDNFIFGIESILIEREISEEELSTLAKKGNLATYFSIVIAFAKGFKLEATHFIRAENLGDWGAYARRTVYPHTKILYRIKEIFASDEQGNESLIKSLIERITTSSDDKNTVVNLFQDLFDRQAEFDPKLLIKLFEALIDVPYMHNLNLLYCINEFVISIDDQESKNELIAPLKKYLKSVNASGHKKMFENLELVSWSLSLILLYLEKIVDKDIEIGFLNGLKNVFILNKSQSYSGPQRQELSFKGRDLFIHSDVLITKIESRLIQEIIRKGIGSNIPEISSVCKMIDAFAASDN